MATDQSPPRIRIILTIAFSALVILVTLNYVFRSYFLMMTEQTEHDHLAKPEELMKLHAGEERNLTTSPVPITKAMAELAARGREGSDALIAPQQSDDLGPMVGWLKNPNTVYLERMAAAAAAPAPDADAGAPDAGATTTPAMGLTPKAPPPNAPPSPKASAAPKH
jgi:hypothetical protein